MAGFGAAAREHVAKPIERFYKRQLYRFRRALLDWQIPHRPQSRRWGSGLPLDALQSIQAGALKYSYRGIPMLKNPFELALYPLLFWKLKPRTVIEIGSYEGASAYWFADMLRTFDIAGKVLSIDISPPAPRDRRDDVQFVKGDARALGAVLTPDILAQLERPLLIVDDSTHDFAATSKLLEFFAKILRAGDYIVIEDGLVSDLGAAHHYDGGPGLAISTFLARHPEFEIDTALCDHYGHNFTGNTNGYLRRR
jgi:cephalosporin hydroxylase